MWLHEILMLELLVELWIRAVFQKLSNFMQYNYGADTSVPRKKATVPWSSPLTLKIKQIKQNQAVLRGRTLLLRKCKNKSIFILVCFLPSQMT